MSPARSFASTLFLGLSRRTQIWLVKRLSGIRGQNTDSSLAFVSIFSWHTSMARISCIVVLGYPHHVTQRGVRSMQVFHRDEERRAYLRYTRLKNFAGGVRGYLFQGRFRSCVLDEDHLLSAARYVELNPHENSIMSPDSPENSIMSPDSPRILPEVNTSIPTFPSLVLSEGRGEQNHAKDHKDPGTARQLSGIDI